MPNALQAKFNKYQAEKAANRNKDSDGNPVDHLRNVMPECPGHGSVWSAAAECVSIVGRHVENFQADGRVRFDWPGTTVRFAVMGSPEIWVRMDGGRNHFNVSVSLQGDAGSLSKSVLQCSATYQVHKDPCCCPFLK